MSNFEELMRKNGVSLEDTTINGEDITDDVTPEEHTEPDGDEGDSTDVDINIEIDTEEAFRTVEKRLGLPAGALAIIGSRENVDTIGDPNPDEELQSDKIIKEIIISQDSEGEIDVKIDEVNEAEEIEANDTSIPAAEMYLRKAALHVSRIGNMTKEDLEENAEETKDAEAGENEGDAVVDVKEEESGNEEVDSDSSDDTDEGSDELQIEITSDGKTYTMDIDTDDETVSLSTGGEE